MTLLLAMAFNMGAQGDASSGYSGINIDSPDSTIIRSVPCGWNIEDNEDGSLKSAKYTCYPDKEKK